MFKEISGFTSLTLYNWKAHFAYEIMLSDSINWNSIDTIYLAVAETNLKQA